MIQPGLHCEQISPSPHEYSFSQFPPSFGSWRWEGHLDIVFSGCLCCNVRNKSHSTCRKWHLWFLRAVKSEKRSCFRLFTMPCSSGQRSFFRTRVLPSHRDVGLMISQLHVKKLLTFAREISYLFLSGWQRDHRLQMETLATVYQIWFFFLLRKHQINPNFNKSGNRDQK